VIREDQPADGKRKAFRLCRRTSRRPRHFATLMLEILEGRALPSFLGASTFSVGMAPRGVAVGDFNGDGTPDMAVAVSGFSA
jgi:hypothetical protein